MKTFARIYQAIGTPFSLIIGLAIAECVKSNNITGMILLPILLVTYICGAIFAHVLCEQNG